MSAFTGRIATISALVMLAALTPGTVPLRAAALSTLPTISDIQDTAVGVNVYDWRHSLHGR